MEWIINHEKVDAGFSSKIILSDEEHFYLDGFVNRQNCRVWNSKKRVISEKQMHPQRVTVLASSNRTFLRMRLVKQQLNDARYRDKITQFFLLKLDDIDVG